MTFIVYAVSISLSNAMALGEDGSMIYDFKSMFIEVLKNKNERLKWREEM